MILHGRIDTVVLCWLNNTLNPDLQEVAQRGRPTPPLARPGEPVAL
jgi:hypothetical protein